jgi:hypothetical protein
MHELVDIMVASPSMDVRLVSSFPTTGGTCPCIRLMPLYCGDRSTCVISGCRVAEGTDLHDSVSELLLLLSQEYLLE